MDFIAKVRQQSRSLVITIDHKIAEIMDLKKGSNVIVNIKKIKRMK